jgi:hypothetical protein
MVEFPLGNIYVRVNTLKKAGDKCLGHVHNFDHATFFIRGRCKVTVSAPRMDVETGKPVQVQARDEDGNPRFDVHPPSGDKRPVLETMYVIERVTEFAPGGFLKIGAQKLHEIEALDDDTLFHCIYAHRTPQGEVMQNFCGWIEAYM